MSKHSKFFVLGLLIGIIISGIALLLWQKSSLDNLNTTQYYDNRNLTQTSSDHGKLLKTPNAELSKPDMLNINNAGVTELMQLPGIGEVKANAIISFRTTYGNFLEISELLYVPGISKSVFDNISNQIYVKPKE